MAIRRLTRDLKYLRPLVWLQEGLSWLQLPGRSTAFIGADCLQSPDLQWPPALVQGPGASIPLEACQTAAYCLRANGALMTHSECFCLSYAIQSNFSTAPILSLTREIGMPFVVLGERFDLRQAHANADKHKVSAKTVIRC